MVAALAAVSAVEHGKAAGRKVAAKAGVYWPVGPFWTLGRKKAGIVLPEGMEKATSMSHDDVVVLKLTCSSCRPLAPAEYGPANAEQAAEPVAARRRGGTG